MKETREQIALWVAGECGVYGIVPETTQGLSTEQRLILNARRIVEELDKEAEG